MPHSPRIALLVGGTSAEREISLESGRQVTAALTTGGFDFECFDPRDVAVSVIPWSRFDLAFLALHGTYGEDGTLQAELDALRVPYTGSGATASASAFHKLRAKRLFQRSGLATPRWRECVCDVSRSTLLRLAGEIGYPLVVKPEAQGSSLGVSLVRGPEELESALAAVRPFDVRCLLEQAIAGEEWTVPVLDGELLPPIKIITEHELFDFSAKYQDDQTVQEVVTADTPTVRQVCALAQAAPRALGCRGLSRVDLRVDRAGKAWLLEVNTLPGLTSHSLVPRSAAALGWEMAELCRQIIHAAIPVIIPTQIRPLPVRRARSA